MTVRKNSIVRIGLLVLFGTAALLSIRSAVSLASGYEDNEELARLIDRYSAATAVDEENQDPNAKDKGKKTSPKKETGKSGKVKSPSDELAAQISKRYFFSPAPPKKKPPKLSGVLGDMAFFGGGKGYTVGQSYQGAKIKEIGPDWVELEVDGKPKKIYVFGKGQGGSSPRSPSRGPSMMRGSRRSGPPSVRPRPAGGIPELSDKMVAQFKKMPPEMRAKAMESMPAEFREKLKKAL